MFVTSMTERFSVPPEATIFTGNSEAAAAGSVTQSRLVFQLSGSLVPFDNVNLHALLQILKTLAGAAGWDEEPMKNR